MRISQLKAELIWKLDPIDLSFRSDCESIAEAQGVQFLCPKCYAENNGEVGTHAIMCWFNNRGVPDRVQPAPGRWNAAGTTIEDLTFVGPGNVSVLLLGPGCGYHGLIEKGGERSC